MKCCNCRKELGSSASSYGTITYNNRPLACCPSCYNEAKKKMEAVKATNKSFMLGLFIAAILILLSTSENMEMANGIGIMVFGCDFILFPPLYAAEIELLGINRTLTANRIVGTLILLVGVSTFF